MPYCYLYQCPRCERDVEIAFGREYEVTPNGERQDYRYPDPDAYEWPQRRVAGLWNRLWCPRCATTREHVIVTLEGPAEHPIQAFLAAEANGLRGDETGPCAACGETLVSDLSAVNCPECGVPFNCIGEYEP